MFLLNKSAPVDEIRHEEEPIKIKEDGEALNRSIIIDPNDNTNTKLSVFFTPKTCK